MVLAAVIVTTLIVLAIARDVLVPLVLALLLYFALAPIVRALARLGLPTPAGAVLVAVTLFAGGALLVYGLAAPAAEFIAQMPQAAVRLRFRIERLMRPLSEMSRVTGEVQALASGNDGEAERVVVSEGGFGPAAMAMLTGRAMLGFGVTVVVTLYLLAFGGPFGQAVLRLITDFGDRRRAMRIGRQVQREISGYLFAITLINTGLAVAVSIVLMLFGMPNAILLGVLAGILNYVPFVGPTIHLGLLFLAGLLAFPFPAQALVPVLAVLALNVIESQLVTPNVLAYRMTLNPILVILSLVLWGWLWGIAGALLAVPMLAAIKITCDHVPRLAPIGTFIGTRGTPPVKRIRR